MGERSFQRKNELIEAALDEFTTKRYENVSLNKIIKNAGISKGTFYYHFKDKQALYIFLHESAYKAEMEFMNSHIEKFEEDHQNLSKSEICKLRFWDQENEACKHKVFAVCKTSFCGQGNLVSSGVKSKI